MKTPTEKFYWVDWRDAAQACQLLHEVFVVDWSDIRDALRSGISIRECAQTWIEARQDAEYAVPVQPDDWEENEKFGSHRDAPAEFTNDFLACVEMYHALIVQRIESRDRTCYNYRAD